ncbi:sensor histidine kinase [Verrucomicrobiales bacterium]|nr:sensor histidine kinase [Verrucomicrobiales bacterium]
MKPKNQHRSKLRSFPQAYHSALEKHLQENSDGIPDSTITHGLGTRTLKLGINLLGLAKIHLNSLTSLEKAGLTTQENGEPNRQSSDFFNAVAEPLEEGRFKASKTGHQLSSTIETLRHHEEDLARSNKNLLAEITRLKEVENSLRTSEETASLLLEQAREMQEEMRSLSRRLITAQEDERKRISRELHDVIAQTLTGINLRLAVLRSQSVANNEDFHEKIQITEHLVEQSVEIVHRFAYDLRPVILDDIGLIPALKSFIKSFTEFYGVEVKTSISHSVEELNSSALTTLYRITQEALTNISRHSKASLVSFSIRPSKSSFRMRITDNGQGFALPEKTSKCQPKRLGILGMRERAEMVGGTFQIESVEGKGTAIQVEIPRARVPDESCKSKRRLLKTPSKIS